MANRYRGPKVSKAKRARIIAAHDGRCAICGAKPPKLTLDHKVPRSYADDAGLVRKLGDAASALEDALSIVNRFHEECVGVDGFSESTPDHPLDDEGRSAETRRYLSMFKRVSEVETAARGLFGAIATECAVEHRERWKREPGTGARVETAPEMVVTTT